VDTKETDDAVLARELLAGDSNAFDRFVESYRTRIFQYSFLMCGQREDAEEVAQETLMRVFESLVQLREPEHLKAWVFRIARNACFMKRRKSVFAPSPSQEISLEELLPGFEQDGGKRKLQIADWSALPDSLVLQVELRGELDRAITELPEIYRTVILLRDVQELSTEETAQVLDVGADVVKTRLHRARLALRKKLDGYLRSVQEVRK
jgi:RNA polymerase sigma-70 factor, ECF subfamily